MCVSLIRNSRSNGCFFCGLTLAVLGNGVSITAAGGGGGEERGACDGWKEFDNALSLVQLLVRKMYKVAVVGEGL